MCRWMLTERKLLSLLLVWSVAVADKALLTRLLPQSPASQQARPSFRIGVCALFADEAPNILEWIAYHRLVGVTDFFLYDHNSTDNVLEPLQSLVDQNLVTVYYASRALPKLEFQGRITEHCFKRLAPQVDWITHIDVDEFLYSSVHPLDGKSQLQTVLEPLAEQVTATYIWRHHYGTSGHDHPPQKMLMCEAYTNRLPVVANAPKWFIRPRTNTMPKGAHAVRRKDNLRPDPVCAAIDGTIIACDEDFEKLKAEELALLPTTLVIAHHVTRSKEDCLAKIKKEASRGNKNWRVIAGREYCIDFDQSATVEDQACGKLALETRQAMREIAPHWYAQLMG